jgi:hypothetical protein
VLLTAFTSRAKWRTVHKLLLNQIFPRGSDPRYLSAVMAASISMLCGGHLHDRLILNDEISDVASEQLTLERPIEALVE